MRVSRICTACPKKNRHFALESTIYVRFQIGLTFWILYSIMKDRVRNYSSKLISNETEAISARLCRNGGVCEKKGWFFALMITIFLRLVILAQFWKYQHFVSISVPFLSSLWKNKNNGFNDLQERQVSHQKTIVFYFFQKDNKNGTKIVTSCWYFQNCGWINNRRKTVAMR